MFGGKLLDHLQQNMAYKTERKAGGRYLMIGFIFRLTVCLQVTSEVSVPVCSVGRLLRNVLMNTWSLIPSSGQSPTLWPADLHVNRAQVIDSFIFVFVRLVFNPHRQKSDVSDRTSIKGPMINCGERSRNGNLKGKFTKNRNFIYSQLSQWRL